MAEQPITMSSGLPSTVLPEPDAAFRHALAQASAGDDPRTAVAAVVAAHPRTMEAWAALGDLGRDAVERYAAYRVGYHRGLDSLRGNGWRGSGYVRWRHESNRGVLSCFDGLRRSAAEIGEADEVERLDLFLRQLDPEWPPADLA